jgi:protein SCO1
MAAASILHRQWRTTGLLALTLLAACAQSQPQFHLQNITGLMPPLKFALVDQEGRDVSERDYRDKVVLLYFGYTHCPDACPTTLAILQGALRQLGATAAGVRVLFVSVDPQRDTSAVLRTYVRNFGSQFVGLRGDESELSKLTRRYRVAYHREMPDAHGYYAVDHSSAFFVFDQQGRVRLLGEETVGPKGIAADLRLLLKGD